MGILLKKLLITYHIKSHCCTWFNLLSEVVRRLLRVPFFFRSCPYMSSVVTFFFGYALPQLTLLYKGRKFKQKVLNNKIAHYSRLRVCRVFWIYFLDFRYFSYLLGWNLHFFNWIFFENFNLLRDLLVSRWVMCLNLFPCGKGWVAYLKGWDCVKIIFF